MVKKSAKSPKAKPANKAKPAKKATPVRKGKTAKKAAKPTKDTSLVNELRAAAKASAIKRLKK